MSPFFWPTPFCLLEILRCKTSFFDYSVKSKVSKLSELKWNSFWITDMEPTLPVTILTKNVICFTGVWLLFLRVAGLGLRFVMQTVLITHRCYFWVNPLSCSSPHWSPAVLGCWTPAHPWDMGNEFLALPCLCTQHLFYISNCLRLSPRIFTPLPFQFSSSSHRRRLWDQLCRGWAAWGS